MTDSQPEKTAVQSALDEMMGDLQNDLWICERKVHTPEHDGGTSYFYYEALRPYAAQTQDSGNEGGDTPPEFEEAFQKHKWDLLADDTPTTKPEGE